MGRDPGGEVPAPCPACAGDVGPARRLFDRDGYRYVACRLCGHAWVHPPPDAAQVLAVYDERYFQGGVHGGYLDYEADEPLHRENARRRLTLLPRPEGALLDVGCAAGFHLDEARSAGWEVAGVDVSPWARAQAGRLGLPVFADVLSAREARRSAFRAVTLLQVLEHDPAPARLLAEVRHALEPGGSLVVETWDRESVVARAFGRHWQQVSPPSVLHLFSRRSLAGLLARSGFEVGRIRRASKEVSLGFAARLVAAKVPAAARPLALLLGNRRWAQRGLRYGLGDLVTVVATRSEEPAEEPADEPAEEPALAGSALDR